MSHDPGPVQRLLVNPELQTQAKALLAALPAAVELPAGGGKTHLLVGTVAEISSNGGRCLVLTHTNAGIHAIRGRLDQLGVSAEHAQVLTITSFAFDLARHYSQLGEITVSKTPNWEDSSEYIAAAQRVADAVNIRRMLSASFTHLLVDEYQDCSRAHHALVCALASAIPKTVVFGDPLQAIFGFRDPLVDWDEVLARFPNHPVERQGWRWRGHNEALGDWLIAIRSLLVPGGSLDFVDGAPSGVAFEMSTPAGLELLRHAGSKPAGESVVIIAPSDRNSCRAVAGKLSGWYSLMEDINGAFMQKSLQELESLPAWQYALWLCSLAKDCFSGFAGLNAGVKARLAVCKPVSTLKRPELVQTLAALDHALASLTLVGLQEAMEAIRLSKEGRLHAHEAWYDMEAAIRATSPDDAALPSLQLASIRDRTRRRGRHPRTRVVSRTVLIKGLEYDHVIISNLDRITDHCNLYVALTRARKSVTIIGTSRVVAISETRRAPAKQG
jgi:hypothetical protein